MTTARALFPDLPRTARGHLSLRLYEAVLALIHYGQGRARASRAAPEVMLKSHPFLRVYLQELSDLREGEAELAELVPRFRQQLALWEQGIDARLPVRALRLQLGLDHPHILALLLTGLVEEDPRFGDVFAAALGGAAVRRPTVGLLYQVTAASGCAAPTDPWSLIRPLVEAGLTEVLNPEDPRADWQLRVPVELWAALGGDTPTEPLPGVAWHPLEVGEPLSEMVMDDGLRGRLVEARGLLESGDATALVVRGLAGSERLAVVGAVAHGLALGVLEAAPPATGIPASWKLLGPLATMVGALPTYVPEPAPGEVFTIPTLGGYRGPVGVVLGHDGGLDGAAADTAVTLQLPPETPELRRQYWARALPTVDGATHRALAESYTLGGRYVRRAAELATAHAALENRDAVTSADVRVAARSINRQQLDTLATRLEDGGGWERLVLHASTAEELQHLALRCRHRERLMNELADGLPGGMNRGVRALFQGPSGTGKTLAARVLASELGLDLYRVDLSSVVSKYIGETEKNLSRVLGRAEDLDIVLLLDEGDSLLAKRTQVRSSHDRWANLETNYLLQRLDSYTGIVVVTTNAPGSIDPSFQRRMDVVVRFHLPNVEERWHLWQQHLPPGHAVDPEVVEDAARRYQLTGGQIRNAAVDAALLAMMSPDRRLRAQDLAAAVDAQLRKSGASSPKRRATPESGRDQAISGFLGAIR